MPVYLGIDGGGTKTRCLMTDEDGRVLTDRTYGPTNPNDIPQEVLRTRFEEIARQMLECAAPHAVFAGIAGALNHKEELFGLLSDCFPGALCGVGSDAQNILSAGLGMRDGCCLISGTGSVCFARVGGELHRIGGWGYLLDDAGSGGAIGRDGICAALRAYDGRGEKTVLNERIRAFAGKPAEALIGEIYGGGKSYLASFAPLVIRAAEDGDPMAQKIVKTNMAALGELLTAAERHFADGFPVTCSGGILTENPYCFDLLKALAPEAAEIALLRVHPVFGAVAEAGRLWKTRK